MSYYPSQYASSYNPGMAYSPSGYMPPPMMPYGSGYGGVPVSGVPISGVPMTGYGMTQPVMYSSSGRSRHHRHHHTPTVIAPGGMPMADPYGQGYYHLSFGQRIARFFGFGRYRYKRQRRSESWGFLGSRRRRRYYDARTGMEVTRKGQQVIRV